MRLRRPGISVLRVGASLFFAGVVYLLWLAAFIPIMKADSRIGSMAGWTSAPVVTALGFTYGVLIFNRIAKAQEASFVRVFPWALIGCGVGAAVVYPFGPMLIVFGMFAAGTACMVVREVVLWLRAT